MAVVLPASRLLLPLFGCLFPPAAARRSIAAAALSVLVLARDGSILRGFLTADGKWRLPVAADEVDPLYRRMLIAAEDRRFDCASGRRPARGVARRRPARDARPCRFRRLDPDDADRAAARAAAAHPAFKVRRDGRGARPGAAARQGRRSSALYLTLAPFGGNLEGVRAASLGLFRQGAAPSVGGRGGAAGRTPALAGAAAPRPPSRGGAAAPATRCSRRMRGRGIISATRLAEARSRAGAAAGGSALPFHAPHLARALRDGQDRPQPVQRTTIDAAAAAPGRSAAAPRGGGARSRRRRWRRSSSTTAAREVRRLCRQRRFRLGTRGTARSIWRARCARRARR